MLKQIFITLLISLPGGFLFQFLHIPLSWMLGPMAAALIWSLVFNKDLYWPVGFRNGGLVILGYMMGISFTIETAVQILKQFPTMLLTTVLTVFFTLLMGYIVYRQAQINLPTTVIGSIPGGLAQMVVLSEEIKGTDATVVTFMQTVRLLSVVFIVPFLAVHAFAADALVQAPTFGMPVPHDFLIYTPGKTILFASVTFMAAWLALYLKFPTPFLVGPMLGAAILVLAGSQAPELPAEFITTAQICVGIYMGTTTRMENLQNWKKLLPYTFMGSLGVVAFSMALGFLLTKLHVMKFTTAFLSTAPGGMAEMALTAMIVKADLSLVSAYQMFRLLFILFVVPPVFKWWLGRLSQRSKTLLGESNNV